MRHVRMLGLCFVAALAVCAYAVSSASALPEWGKCEAKAGGKYADSNCTVKAKKGAGAFEWLKASQVAAKRKAEGKSANIPFSGHSVGNGGVLTSGIRQCTLSPTFGPKQLRVTRQKCAEEGAVETSLAEESGEPIGTIECANEASVGEAAATNKVENVHVTFTGCEFLGLAPCNSKGKEEGEIETNLLKGELGYINKAAKEVGVLLEPAKKGGLFAQFVCPGFGLEIHVGAGNDKEGAEYASSGCYGVCPGTTPAEEKHGGYDGIISPVAPVNEMTSKETQTYTQESGYPWRNIPSKFEGKHIDVLEDTVGHIEGEGSQFSPAGEVITNVNTSEEPGEIKA